MIQKPKITIVGAGNVGATAAHAAAVKGLGDIVLLDVLDGIPQGKALDMMEMCPIDNLCSQIVGSNDYADTADSDVVVITAGLARKPGMSRDDLLAKNAEIISSVTKNIAEHSPNAIIVMVTNPLDVMCHVAKDVSGFPQERVFGQAGVLDCARFRCFIAQELGISVADTSALVLGGHGDSMVPLTRYSYAGGIPIENLISSERLEAIVKRTRMAGGEIVGYLKTGSAYYSPATAAITMVESIVGDQKRILPSTVLLNGEYGLNDVYMGVPVRLGASGVEHIYELELKPEESEALKRSAVHILQTKDRLAKS